MKEFLIKNKEKIKHLMTYGIFGLLTTAVDIGTFYILTKIFPNAIEEILNIISIIVSIIFAYYTNRKYVFKSNEKNILEEFLKFVASRTFTTLLNIVLFPLFKIIFPINTMIIKIIINIIVIILNYVISVMVVFKQKK